jgi:hypothetical protein
MPYPNNTIPGLLDKHIQMPTYERFTTFFIVKKTAAEGTFQNMSPFKIQKIIMNDIGNVINTKKLRDGSLLIQVRSADQAERISKLQLFGTTPVVVSPHKTLNSSKGVVYCPELVDLTEQEIANEMKTQNVIEVRRINLRRDGELKPSPLHILTFNSVTPPENIFAGYIRLEVRKHVPNPLRCMNCQKYGHHQQYCKKPVVCDKCGQSNVHEGKQCLMQIQCANCKEPHPSWSRDCKIWKMEKEIQEIRTSEKLTYPEAKRRYERLHPKLMMVPFSKVVAANTVNKEETTQPPSTANEIKQMMEMMAQILAGQKQAKETIKEQTTTINQLIAQINQITDEMEEQWEKNKQYEEELKKLKQKQIKNTQHSPKQASQLPASHQQGQSGRRAGEGDRESPDPQDDGSESTFVVVKGVKKQKVRTKDEVERRREEEEKKKKKNKPVPIEWE